MSGQGAAALVVGIGNPLRQDDGLGWQVVEQLSALLGAAVETAACQQLTPELAERISGWPLVVFVDARQGGRPGQVRRRVLQPARDDEAAFSHQLEPSALLAWSAALYGAAPKAYLVTVDGGAFGYGQALSPAVAAALPEVTRLIAALLAGQPLEAERCTS